MENKHTRTFIYAGTSFLVFLAIVYFFWLRPNQQLNDTKASLTVKEFTELKSTIRSGLAQALGGAALLIGLGFTWRNIRATEKNLIIAQESVRATQETAAKNLAIASEGQITERFTRAIEQLGNEDSLAIRLGGIYGLERIAQDLQRDHWPIIEILSAFVREKAGWEAGKPKDENPLTDVQAVLSVLSRRERKFEDDATPKLDLTGTDLRVYPLNHLRLDKANLSNAHLEETDGFKAQLDGSTLIYARLDSANFTWASFKNANLAFANLRHAKLNQADLERANLSCADLQGTILAFANLKGANFDQADLRGANLTSCNLEGTSLYVANLTGVDLASTTGLTKDQIDVAITDAHTKFPEELQASLSKQQ